jgi:hypothetical protein
MPLWAAVAIAVAAFGLRTLLRGWSFDRTDALVVALFAIVLAMTAIVRAWIRASEDSESAEDSGSDAHADEPPVDRLNDDE